MYAVGGETDLTEVILDHLTGYELAEAGAHRQRRARSGQHDVWGALSTRSFLHLRSGEFLSGSTWKGLAEQVDRAIARWTEPDQGIWEIGADRSTSRPRGRSAGGVRPGRQARRGHGQVRRGPALARPRPTASRPTSWTRASTSAAVFTQAYGSTALDASLLLAPLLRFLPADGPRIVATTVSRSPATLRRRAGVALSHRGDRRRPRGPRGHVRDLFVLAGLGVGGDRELDRARELCEPRICRSALGLYAEEIDPHRPALGNFPQAFTHLAQINALMHIIRAEEAAGRRDAHRSSSAGQGSGLLARMSRAGAAFDVEVGQDPIRNRGTEHPRPNNVSGAGASVTTNTPARATATASPTPNFFTVGSPLMVSSRTRRT
jgi:hypothetical protein